LNKHVLSYLQNSVYESVSQSNGGRLFHTKGLAAENSWSPSLHRVRTVVAALVVADWRNQCWWNVRDCRDMLDSPGGVYDTLE